MKPIEEISRSPKQLTPTTVLRVHTHTPVTFFCSLTIKAHAASWIVDHFTQGNPNLVINPWSLIFGSQSSLILFGARVPPLCSLVGISYAVLRILDFFFSQTFFYNANTATRQIPDVVIRYQEARVTIRTGPFSTDLGHVAGEVPGYPQGPTAD